jgi:MFS transporter, PAT family, beta-lactamase induction signal transducer AmpG
MTLEGQKLTTRFSTQNIPTLSQSSLLRYFAFAALYVAQGLPEGLIIYALPAWLAKNGLTPAQIGGYVGIAVLPWSFKLVHGPIMDRFSFLSMGRRRPWVLIGQTGLFLSFFALASLENPANDLVSLMVMGFLVSLFASIQDVAVDGMAIDILPEDQQARANGIMWGSKVAGISLSVAVSSWFINEFGFQYAVMLFSTGILIIFLVPLFLRERPGEKLLPWTNGKASKESLSNQLDDWKSIFKNLFKVFMMPTSLIMGIAVFSNSTGRGLIDAVLPVFTVQELGWEDTGYSNVFSTASLIAGVAGMFIGGALIDFLGKKRMMSIFLVLLAALVIAMSSLSFLWENRMVIIVFIITFYVLFTQLTIAIFATAMQLCWKKVAASQFTLYMAIANLGLSTGASLLGPLTSVMDYKYVILFSSLCSVIMLILLRFANLNKHSEQLEGLN